MKFHWSSKLVVIIFLIFSGIAGRFGYKVYEYKVIHWLPGYFWDLTGREKWSDKVPGAKHLVFVLVDHHEPGRGEKGLGVSRSWCSEYEILMHDVIDHHKNRFRYTWYYPIDHNNSAVVSELTRLTNKGFGEIEVHWHDNKVDDETFIKNMSKGLTMLKDHGCFGEDKSGMSRFSYIAGNWNLDHGSDPCFTGVSRQLEALQTLGCYADLTFSTVFTDAQPKKINSIYYAKDSDSRKSYDTGIDSIVGGKADGLLMLQGPCGFNFSYLFFEWGALESWLGIDFHRFTNMLEDCPSIFGRPDVRFMKLHTHGIQSRSLILSPEFKKFINKISKYCIENKISLHYCSAREAYNIIKALESGEQGDIEEFRNYEISVPRNVTYVVE